MEDTQEVKNAKTCVSDETQTRSEYAEPKLEKLKKLADVTGAPKMTGNWQQM